MNKILIANFLKFLLIYISVTYILKSYKKNKLNCFESIFHHMIYQKN